LAGESIYVAVTTGDTATTMGTNMAAAINAVADIPCNATAAAGVVTLTTVNSGLAVGDLDIRFNYYGAAGGQAFPAGVAVAVATTQAGATNPMTALTTALGNLGNMPFDFIVTPYTDTASLNLITAFLNYTTGRWAWNQQIYGSAFTAFRGTVGARSTFAAARGQDPFISCMGFYDSPTPAYIWAANYAGACAASLRVAPALPLGGAGDGVDLTVLAPPVQSQDTFPSLQILLSEGISTYKANSSGLVRVDRACNMYTTNPAGYPDNSFFDVETNYTLMACIRQLLSQLSTQFGRKTLVADGTTIAGGSNMVTAQTVLQVVNSIYASQCLAGLCQNATLFAANSQATNAGNGLVTLFLPYQIANQLRVIAGSVAFSKP
jgi:phage tail sheath gpL-like